MIIVGIDIEARKEGQMKPPVFLVLATLAMFTVGASATQPGQATLKNWKVMDACAKQAQAAFPDFNADSNAKRDAKLNQCLSTSILPPRQPLSSPRSQ
jgi:hypothetical protein